MHYLCSMKKSLFLITTLVFVVACGSTKFITPSETDVRRGKNSYSTLTLQQLTEGQQIYQTYCSKCHPYKKPMSRSAMEWQTVIPEMTVKTNHKFGNVIDAGKQEALLRYVTVMATASK